MGERGTAYSSGRGREKWDMSMRLLDWMRETELKMMLMLMLNAMLIKDEDGKMRR